MRKKGIQYILIYLFDLVIAWLAHIVINGPDASINIWAVVIVAVGMFVVSLIISGYYDRVVFVESIDEMENAPPDTRAQRIARAILGVIVSVIVCVLLLGLLQGLTGFKTTVPERFGLSIPSQLMILATKID